MRSMILLSTTLCLSLGLNACKKNQFNESAPKGPAGAGSFLGKGAPGTGDGSKEGDGSEEGGDDGTGKEGTDGKGGDGKGGDGTVITQDPENPGDVTGGKVEEKVPTDNEKKIIANCAKALGMELPLNGGKVRTIAASVSVLGAGAVLSDKRVTEQPELTLILAGVNVLGSVKWELMNPKGLYCIVTNVNVLSKLTVEISKTAQLAEGVIGVNVLSAANQSSSSVGVNVLSNVKVIQK